MRWRCEVASGRATGRPAGGDSAAGRCPVRAVWSYLCSSYGFKVGRLGVDGWTRPPGTIPSSTPSPVDLRFSLSQPRHGPHSLVRSAELTTRRAMQLDHYGPMDHATRPRGGEHSRRDTVTRVTPWPSEPRLTLMPRSHTLPHTTRKSQAHIRHSRLSHSRLDPRGYTKVVRPILTTRSQ